MADDATPKGIADRERINTHLGSELREWSKRLNVSEEKLIETIMIVGPMADDVRSHLKSRGLA
jgi:hypothetical protein